MNEIETHRYDYLRRKRYVVHEEHEQFIRPETRVRTESGSDRIIETS